MSQTESALSYNEDDTTYCAVHKDRETSLRCNKCDRYMCAECAVQTPIGYRCRQCVREHENTFFRGTNTDYIVAGGVALALGAVAGAIMYSFGWIIFAIIIAFPVGGAIAEVALRTTGKRRGRNSAQVVAIATGLGILAGGVIRSILRYNDARQQLEATFGAAVNSAIPSMLDFVTDDIFGSWGFLLFLFIAAYAVYIRFR